MKTDHLFCDLPASALQSFEAIKYATAYPKGAVLFVEGQAPRGIFVLCKGRVKLSICSTDGKTLILKIAETGEVLGLSATVSGKPYELTAETVDPCQINFVKREDFLRFLREHSEACLRVAEQLSEKYNTACREIRSLGLSHSAAEKLARLLLDWSARNGESSKQEPRVKLALTHEEIAQMIGTSRETVTRLFAELKKRQIVQAKGSTLVIRNKAALKSLADGLRLRRSIHRDKVPAFSEFAPPKLRGIFFPRRRIRVTERSRIPRHLCGVCGRGHGNG